MKKMKFIFDVCIELYRIKSSLGDMVEVQVCSNYPDCPSECKKDHRKPDRYGLRAKSIDFVPRE